MKKHIAIITIIILIFQLSVVSTFATAKPTVSVGSATAKPGETVEIPIALSETVTFSNLAIEVGYDGNVLSLTQAASSIVGASFTPAQTISSNPYNLQWDSASNVTASGTIATLTFVIDENAANGVYPITVSYYKGRNGNNTDGDDVNYDADYNSLNLEYVSGSVTVNAPVQAHNEISLTSENAVCGQEFAVDIKLSNEISMANLALEIGYDNSAMEIISVQNNVSGASFTAAQNYTANPYNLQWDNASNVAFSGNIAKLKFKAIKSGSYAITSSYYKGRNGNNIDGDDVNYDEEYNPVELSYKGTTIQIENAQNSITISDLVNDTNITANVGLTSATANINGTIYVGAYKDSKLMSAAKYDAQNTMSISIAKNNADTLKIMWWDDNMSPMCEAQTITLN